MNGRAEVLREAAAAIEAEQAREEVTQWAQQDEPDPETELEGAAVRASAALLRRMAAEAGKDTHPGESTRDDGQEPEPLLLTWERGVDLPEDGTAGARVVCRTPRGGRAVLVLDDTEQRAALASLLDMQWVDIRERCGTAGCGLPGDLLPAASPDLASGTPPWGWVQLAVAGTEDPAPRWWCSSMCAWSALARAGEELADDERADEYGLGEGRGR